MFLVPDVIRNPLRYAANRIGFYKYKGKNDQKRYDCKESLLSIARLVGAYGFFRLSEKALGAATFAAVKDNKLMTAGLVVVEGLVSVPTLLIHVGGVAIRNNLPELFKAWTEKNVSSHAVGLGCFALGVILLTSYVRSLPQQEMYRGKKENPHYVTYDRGYVDLALSRKAYNFAFEKHPPK